MNPKKKLTKLKLLTSGFIFFTFFSCFELPEDKVKRKLEGQWALEFLHYKSVNYKDSLFINYVAFESNNFISLPETKAIEKDYDSEWHIINEDSLLIKSKNYLFNGTYKIQYIIDNDRMIVGVDLKSDSTYIRAFKMYQDFHSVRHEW